MKISFWFVVGKYIYHSTVFPNCWIVWLDVIMELRRFSPATEMWLLSLLSLLKGVVSARCTNVWRIHPVSLWQRKSSKPGVRRKGYDTSRILSWLQSTVTATSHDIKSRVPVSNFKHSLVQNKIALGTETEGNTCHRGDKYLT